MYEHIAEVAARVDVQFEEDMPEMPGHSAFGQKQHFGYLRIGSTFGGHGRDASLGWGQ